ncbi:MAG: anti-FecI sigma factor, FecR [Gemmatimonadetes bacterium]|nr:anti-FecI sigma factor, FecR [Gemmatimonadota bacterium]
MSDVDWDLLFRYLGEECSAEEQARVVEWLAADEQHRMLLEAAMIAGGRTLAKLPAAPGQQRRPSTTHAPRRARTWATAAAASLVVLLGGAVLVRGIRAGQSRHMPAVAVRTTVTGRGQRDTLRLFDGTRVILGAQSTLRYPEALTGNSRDVYLTGEGYFEVVHDSQHPFRVHAEQATVEDLGTTFGVRAYAEEASVQVVVADGMVALGAAKSTLEDATVLTRNQMGSLANGNSVASVRRVNADAYLGWVGGRLVFDETPLTDVAVRLEQWFGIKVRIADTVHASNQLSASFTNESLSEVLAALAPALDVRIERTGNTVVIHPRNHDQ